MTAKTDIENTKDSNAVSVESTALFGDSFPMECVRYLASKSCGCQWSAPTLERNSHWPSCMVGKAQAFLGRRVSWECNGKPCNPPNR